MSTPFVLGAAFLSVRFIVQVLLHFDHTLLTHSIDVDSLLLQLHTQAPSAVAFKAHGPARKIDQNNPPADNEVSFAQHESFAPCNG